MLPKKRTKGPASNVAMRRRAAALGVPPNASLRCEYIRCGRCPKLHGPYWYAYWREDGKLRKRYLGADVGSSKPRRKGRPR